MNTFLNSFLENIFTQQPGYYSDLDEAVPSVLQVSPTHGCVPSSRRWRQAEALSQVYLRPEMRDVSLLTSRCSTRSWTSAVFSVKAPPWSP